MGTERVHGPYKHRQKWRVIEVGATGKQSSISFATEREANAYIQAARREIEGLTVGDAVNQYLDFRAVGDGRKIRPIRESTLKLERWRLVWFLRLTEGDRPVSSLTRAVANNLLEKRKADGLAVDTLISELACVGRFARWLVSKGKLPVDPFAELVVLGERSAGKVQLRIDEARKFLEACLDDETEAGVACALTLLTGMRASEVTGLTVHDLDDGGRVLWVEDNLKRRLKTTNSKRKLRVPAVLVGPLKALTVGKGPGDQIFGPVDRRWLGHWVPRFCRLAGVPVVCPHGLRGTWASIAAEAVSAEHVAGALGNTPEMSRTSYIAPGVEQSRSISRAEATLQRETTADNSFPTPIQPDSPLVN